MAASAREIERQIDETRDRIETNLDRLQARAISDAVRYGRIAAIGVGVLALGGVAWIVIRRTRRSSLKDRRPAVTVRVNEKGTHESRLATTVASKVAPAIAAAASRVLLERITRRPEPTSGR